MSRVRVRGRSGKRASVQDPPSKRLPIHPPLPSAHAVVDPPSPLPLAAQRAVQPVDHRRCHCLHQHRRHRDDALRHRPQEALRRVPPTHRVPCVDVEVGREGQARSPPLASAQRGPSPAAASPVPALEADEGGAVVGRHGAHAQHGQARRLRVGRLRRLLRRRLGRRHPPLQEHAPQVLPPQHGPGQLRVVQGPVSGQDGHAQGPGKPPARHLDVPEGSRQRGAFGRKAGSLSASSNGRRRPRACHGRAPSPVPASGLVCGRRLRQQGDPRLFHRPGSWFQHGLGHPATACTRA
mmetsp:Transcript_36764/g.85411  ORF Transcript_36764/g.85411 Transcript_36764/m.85411 type:complete len:294 (-) Transcript_36764:510-1391(-)